MKRNTLVLGITLFVLAGLAWAGWANFEYRRQAADKVMAASTPPVLIKASTDDDPPSPLLNKPAPNFTLQDLSGKKVSLADYKGKAVLINFWATWCGPCKLETPWLVELRQQYADKGFEILGISAENDDLASDDKDGWAKQKASVSKFVQQMHMQYPVLINGDSIAKDYGGLDVMPTSFFVDRNGVVVATQLGIDSKDAMAAKIEKILGLGKPADEKAGAGK
ncbi:MAG TPA: TlpA disulfide reductase family protein [Terracidiphilus sp.]